MLFLIVCMPYLYFACVRTILVSVIAVKNMRIDFSGFVMLCSLQ